MGVTTEIAWCDATFNPWIGCAKVADGCTHCYAESYAKRYGKAQWGLHGTRVKTSEAYWKQPIKWNREAEAAGERRRVFCASLADVFEDWQGPIVNAKGEAMFVRTDVRREWCGNIGDFPSGRPATMDDVRARLFALIDTTPNLDWLLLTKRPENIRRMWPIPANGRDPGADDYLRRDNVWLLTSIATQADADKNVPELLNCRDLVPVLGLSAEPLLGEVNLGPWMAEPAPAGYRMLSRFHGPNGFDESGQQPERAFKLLKPQPLQWVIVGGESGHEARPMHPDWARSIRDQCQAAGVPFFFKQWGEFRPMLVGDQGRTIHRFNDEAGTWCANVGKKAAGRLLDGVEWNEYPAAPLQHVS